NRLKFQASRMLKINKVRRKTKLRKRGIGPRRCRLLCLKLDNNSTSLSRRSRRPKSKLKTVGGHCPNSCQTRISIGRRQLCSSLSPRKMTNLSRRPTKPSRTPNRLKPNMTRGGEHSMVKKRLSKRGWLMCQRKSTELQRFSISLVRG